MLFPAGGTPLPRTEAMVIVRALHARQDEAAKKLLGELGKHTDPVVAAGASVVVPPAKVRTKALFTLAPDRQQAEGVLAAWFGDSFAVEGVSDGVPVAELSFADCDTFDFPGHAVVAPTSARVFLNQGSLVQGDVIGITADDVRVRTAMFGEVVLPRREVQGIALDAGLDRLVGASAEQDRVRLRDATFADGALLRGDASTLVLRSAGGRVASAPCRSPTPRACCSRDRAPSNRTPRPTRGSIWSPANDCSASSSAGPPSTRRSQCLGSAP